MTAVRSEPHTAETSAPSGGTDRTGIFAVAAAGALGWSVVANVEGWPSLPSGTVEAVIVITMGYALLSVLGARVRLRCAVALLGLFSAYGGVTLASVLVSSDIELAQLAWEKLVRAMVIGVTGYLIASRLPTLRWLTWGAIIGAGAVSFGALLGGPPPLTGLDAIDINGRLVGPLGDGNFFGQHLLVGLALAMGVMRRERLARPLLGAATVAGLSFVAILATESRGAILGLAAIGLAQLRLLSRRGRALAVAVVVTAGVLLLPGSGLGDRLGRAPASIDSALEHGVAEDTAVAGRLSENIAALRMAADHPILGIGFGTYQREYLHYARDIALDHRLEERDAHNLHLEILAETGAVGALVWLAILLVVARELVTAASDRRAPTELRRLAGAWGLAFLAFVVTAVFLHDNHPEIQWLLLGVGFGIGEVHRRNVDPASIEEAVPLRERSR